MVDLFDLLNLYDDVRILLDDSDRQKAIDAAERLYNQFHNSFVVYYLACSIVKELRRSKEISEEIMRDLIQSYPYLPGEAPKEKKKDSDDDDEDSDDDDGDSDDDDKAYEHPHYYEFDTNIDIDREEPTEQDRKVLLEVCSETGCTLKKGQEQKILELMITFFSLNLPRFESFIYNRRACITSFFRCHVVEYIDSVCPLKDFDIVERAINTAKQQMIKEITVPTNEEGEATPTNQFNKENRECVMECKNATSLNLAKQKEISCLTTSVNEQTKEYGNVVTSLKLEEVEEEESTVDIDVRLAPEWKDREIEERLKPRKRKLEFSHPGSV